MSILFWILLGTIVYAYLGYTLLLLIMSLFKRKKECKTIEQDDLPEITLVIAAYNEKSILTEKLLNSAQINYPKEKFTQIWVTDGSSDGSEIELQKHSDITVLHSDERKGKMAAINRAMKQVSTPITVFCDANTMLHPDSIYWMVSSLSDKTVGCVAGEKSIEHTAKDSAAGSGEGAYWNYESLMKKLESQVGSTIGAAGELFAIRTELFEEANTNTVIDDFVITLKIALKGHKIAYQPKAIATEKASYSISEERKRKIRIAAGSFQVLFGMPQLLNIFKHGILSFQYISHKALRWLIVPIAIPTIAVLNIAICYFNPSNMIFNTLLVLQAFFYLLVLLGKLFSNKRTKVKMLFLPYYIIMMNYAIILGFIRYLKGSQSAAWEKAKRQT